MIRSSLVFVLMCLVGPAWAGPCDNLSLINDGRTFNWCAETPDCWVVIRNEDPADTGGKMAEVFQLLSGKGCGLLVKRIQETSSTTRWYVTYVVPKVSETDLLLDLRPALHLADGTMVEASDWLTSEEVDGKPAKLECATRDLLPGWLYAAVAKTSKKGNFWTIMGFPRSYRQDAVEHEWQPSDVVGFQVVPADVSSSRP